VATVANKTTDSAATLANDEVSPSDSISISEQALVNPIAEHPVKAAAHTEHETFCELMSKAKTMDPAEFRKYLREHKEREEKRHRSLGGGVAGGGDWIWRGEKAVRGEYLV
jgi:hypothetical protein